MGNCGICRSASIEGRFARYISLRSRGATFIALIPGIMGKCNYNIAYLQIVL